MTKTLELAVNSGRIYAGMMKLAKEKQDFQKRVDEIYSDPKLSDEGKKEYELLWRNKYEETCKKANEDMQEAVNELQNAVVTDEFRPSQAMRDTIDFIQTMKKGGCFPKICAKPFQRTRKSFPLRMSRTSSDSWFPRRNSRKSPMNMAPCSSSTARSPFRT